MASGLYRKLNNRRTKGFTLIELLVVIGIIALLAAIIFPVFAIVRENAKQTTSIANLHDISTKLELYKLDKHQYPDVLFGYAYTSTGGVAEPMDKAYDAAVADDLAAGSGTRAKDHFPGLYPEYIRDVSEFQDPDNLADNSTAAIVSVVNDLSSSGGTPGTLVANNSHSFYPADAYDLSPRIAGTNALDDTHYLVRYQRSWSDIVALAGTPPLTTLTPPGGLTPEQYIRQLHWQFPPANTYVTMTTYHVISSNKVIVLLENGSAKSVDVSKYANSTTGETETTIAVSSNKSQANFWLKTP